MIVSSILHGALVRVLIPHAVALMVPSLSGVRPLRASPVVLRIGGVMYFSYNPTNKTETGESK